MLRWACVDGSAIFAQLTAECPFTLQWAAPSSKLPLPWGFWTPIHYVIRWARPSSQPVNLSGESAVFDFCILTIYCSLWYYECCVVYVQDMSDICHIVCERSQSRPSTEVFERTSTTEQWQWEREDCSGSHRTSGKLIPDFHMISVLHRQ